MKINAKLDKSAFFIAIDVLLLMALAIFLGFRLRTDEITLKAQNKETILILFNVAQKNQLLFSELFFYNPSTSRGALLDIPPNVGMQIPSLGRIDSIDSVYRFYSSREYMTMVESLVGQKIPYVVNISLSQFGVLTDLLSGIEYLFPDPVEDKTLIKGKTILLPAGNAVLDGDKVVDFILYISSQGTETVAPCQKLLATWLKTVSKRTEYVASVFGLFSRNYSSNLSDAAWQSLIARLKNMNADQMIQQRILGSTDKVTITLKNGNKTEAVSKELLFPHYENRLVKETVRNTLDSLASDQAKVQVRAIKLQVLNGTQQQGLAKKSGQIFESFGYEVSSLGNAEKNDYEKTVVIDRKGVIDNAIEVAKIIKCAQYRTEMDNSSVSQDNAVDVTIIVGKDFDGRYCKN